MNSTTTSSTLTPSEARSTGKANIGVGVALYALLLTVITNALAPTATAVLGFLNPTIAVKAMTVMGWLPAVSMWVAIIGSILGVAGAILLLGAPARSRTFWLALSYSGLMMISGCAAVASYLYPIKWFEFSIRYYPWFSFLFIVLQFLQAFLYIVVIRRLAIFIQDREIVRSTTHWIIVHVINAVTHACVAGIADIHVAAGAILKVLFVLSSLLLPLWAISLSTRIRRGLHTATTETPQSTRSMGIPLRWGLVGFLLLEGFVLTDYLIASTSFSAGVLNWPMRFVEGSWSRTHVMDWAKGAWIYFAAPVFVWFFVRSREDHRLFARRFRLTSSAYTLAFITAFAGTAFHVHSQKQKAIAKYGALSERGQPPTLVEGSQAPPFEFEEIVNGLPSPDLFDGKVHVVEFWGTWCRPCIDNIPHMNALVQKYSEEVSVLSITTESKETVKGFLYRQGQDGKTWSEIINYPLGVDSQHRMQNSYFLAARQSGIPCAFVVGTDGVIEWIGHPARMERVLGQVVSGSFDRQREEELQAWSEANRNKITKLKSALNGVVKLSKTERWTLVLAKLDEIRREVELFPEGADLIAFNRKSSELFELFERIERLAARSANSRIWSLVRMPTNEPLPEDIREIEAIADKYQLGVYFNTLGVAQYRAGRYELAIESCEKSAKLTPEQDDRYDSPFAGDLAILAMSHFQLGNTELARTYRSRLNAAMELEAFKKDEDCLQLLNELNSLFDD